MKKPTDLDLQCLSSSMRVCIKKNSSSNVIDGKLEVVVAS